MKTHSRKHIRCIRRSFIHLGSFIIFASLYKQFRTAGGGAVLGEEMEIVEGTVSTEKQDNYVNGISFH
jgi:hypothetical protein